MFDGEPGRKGRQSGRVETEPPSPGFVTRKDPSLMFQIGEREEENPDCVSKGVQMLPQASFGLLGWESLSQSRRLNAWSEPRIVSLPGSQRRAEKRINFLLWCNLVQLKKIRRKETAELIATRGGDSY